VTRDFHAKNFMKNFSVINNIILIALYVKIKKKK
jgi:hypothetical protein